MNVVEKLKTKARIWRLIWRQGGSIALARLAAGTLQKKSDTVRLDDCWFGVGALSYVLACQFRAQTYEAAERGFIRHYLDPSLPVIELGGCLGVVSCITNHKLTNRNNHIVVEANPYAVPLLRENAARNNAQFKIINAAVAYGTTEVTLYVDPDFLGSSMALTVRDRKAVVVPPVTLSELLRSIDSDACTLICDIEGAECDMVSHDLSLICTSVALILIETHGRYVGQEKTQQMLAMLKTAGFHIIHMVPICGEADDFVYVLRNSKNTISSTL